MNPNSIDTTHTGGVEDEVEEEVGTDIMIDMTGTGQLILVKTTERRRRDQS